MNRLPFAYPFKKGIKLSIELERFFKSRGSKV
jgi:hypothetical protein